LFVTLRYCHVLGLYDQAQAGGKITPYPYQTNHHEDQNHKP